MRVDRIGVEQHGHRQGTGRKLRRVLKGQARLQRQQGLDDLQIGLRHRFAKIPIQPGAVDNAVRLQHILRQQSFGDRGAVEHNGLFEEVHGAVIAGRPQVL